MKEKLPRNIKMPLVLRHRGPQDEHTNTYDRGILPFYTSRCPSEMQVRKDGFMKIPKARQLPSGSWFIQLRLDGRSIPVTAAQEDECVAQALAIKAGIIKVKKAPAKMTLGEACDAYIAAGTLRSPSTVAGYKRLRKNTFQGIMSRQLSALTNDMINKEITRMVNDGKAWKYISNAIGLIRPVLKEYYSDFELSIKTPTNKKTRSREKARAKAQALPTEAEVQAILSAAKGTEIELPILLAMWLGMRMSEIRGLRFGDIEDNQMHICAAIVDDENGKPAEKDTKTDAGDRWIAVPDYILSLVPDGEPDEHIVKLSGQAIYKRYSRLLEKNGIRHFRFHDLRCVNAAAMILLGVDSKYAMEHNGWSTEHMYKQVYGYIMAEKLAKEANRVDEYFLNKFEIANEIANKK